MKKGPEREKGMNARERKDRKRQKPANLPHSDLMVIKAKLWGFHLSLSLSLSVLDTGRGG